MAKPFEMNEIEKALRAAIRDDLVRSSNLWFF